MISPMNPVIRGLPWLLALLLTPAAGLAEPLRVFASVAPIQSFIAAVGGSHVDARAMVRPGFDPHTYDPTPQQISALAEAVLYVRTGVPFEQVWMKRIRSANPRMEVIDARDGIALRRPEAHDDEQDGHDEHEEAHGHEEAGAHDHAGEWDPHVWVSPRLARHMAGVIRDALTALAPAHAADFARNYDAFATELDALDRELRVLLDPLPHRKFMVFHPAWGYFADQYGLIQVPIEREGKGPGARGLAELIGQAKRDGIKTVFVQPQFDKRKAAQVARAIDGGVISVDPLHADYINNLRRVGREFARALRP